MRIQSGQLVSLGYGKFVRSDDVVAIEPIVLPLDQAAEAHRILEARQSPGGIVLVP